eukprot:m.204986 g.204986  ORF g.204986 m.204986 type:complete len:717 (-) comp15396_c0_seq4:1702-3852(-)
MSVSDFVLYLQRPVLQRLQRARFYWQWALIGGAGVGAYFLLGQPEERDELYGVLGGVFLAAGMLPFLLSLPLILARITVKMLITEGGSWFSFETIRNCQFFVDTSHTLATLAYAAFTATGIFFLVSTTDCEENEGWDVFADEMANILAEIAVITTVTTLLNVPTVDDDATRTLLSRKENLQLERSGSLNAPWARAVNFSLCEEYRSDMEWLFPDDMDLEDHPMRKYFRQARKRTTTIEPTEPYQSSEEPRGIRAAEMMNESAAGWESPFYVAALGRCSRAHLGDELVSGLFQYLTGAQAYNTRFLTQAAVTSLGNLYFGTANDKVSRRLFDVWMMHEISNVRNHCAAAINAIGNTVYVELMRTVTDVPNLSTIAAVAGYVDMHEGPGGREARLLQSTDILELTTSMSSPDWVTRFTALVAACVHCATAEITSKVAPRDLVAFVSAVKTEVLDDLLEYHLVKTLGLEVVGRMAGATVQPGGVSPNNAGPDDLSQIVFMAWEAGVSLLRTSVFKSVRQAATRLLEQSAYPYLRIYKVFDDAATAKFALEGFSSETIDSLLSSTLTNTMYTELNSRATAMKKPRHDLTQMYKTREKLAFEPTLDPTVLLYFLLSHSNFTLGANPELFIQDRLNSSDRLERFVALLCIGHFRTLKGPEKLKDEVVPIVATCELVSTVRDLAVEVMGFSNGGCCAGPDTQIDRRNAMVERELQLLKDRTST